MRIVQDLQQAKINVRARRDARTHLTIGVFDGVHLGHQKLINRLVETAHAAEQSAVLMTFKPHPVRVLHDAPPPPSLTTVEERAAYLAKLNLDLLVVLPFTPELARTPAPDFVEQLDRHLHLSALWGGPDLALGHRREGNVALLRRLGAARGFSVHIVQPTTWGGDLVSSSRIREALQKEGDIRQATGCLGRPYRLTGSVVHGRNLGRQIGIPTANISPPPQRLMPAGGVYACMAHTETLGVHPAVVNVGTRPTFTGKDESQDSLVAEAHLLNFDADLYGQTLALDFIDRLRDERPFSTLNALVAQIQADIRQAAQILKESGVGSVQVRRRSSLANRQ